MHEKTSGSKAMRKVAYFRWRMLPGFALTGLSAAVGILYYNNVIVGGIPATHPNHLLIFLSGIVWLVGSIFWFRGKWSLATAATIAGFALPFFRPIY